MSRIVPFVKRNWLYIAIGIVAVVGLSIIGLATWQLPAPKFYDAMEESDAVYAAIIGAQKQNAAHISLWYKSNIYMQIVLIITSVSAAVLASITTKENVKWVKNWTVFVTASTAIVTAGYATFNVKDNIEVFIQSAEALNELEMDYLIARAEFEPQLNAGTLNNAEDLKRFREMQRPYLVALTNIAGNRMRAWASIGRETNNNRRMENLRDSGEIVDQ